MSILPKAIQYIYNSRIPLACAIIASIGMFLRFMRLGARDLWGDEVYQFYQCVGPMKPFWLHNFYGDFSCFPGDYIITYPFIQYFGQNKWGVMIPHILFTFVGFYLFYLLCQRYLKTTLGFAIAFALFAFNDNLVVHNFDLRPYSVLPTLAVGGLYFANLLFSEFSRLTKWHKLGIGLFYLYTVIFHIYGLVILSLIFLFEFLARYKESASEMKKANFIKYFISLYCILAIVWVWYASPMLQWFGFAQKLFLGDRPTFEYIPNPVIDFIGFLKGIFGNLLTTDWLKWTILGMVCVFLPGNIQRYKQLGFFFICIGWGIMIVFLLSLFKHYWFVQRQFIWVMPLFAFFIGWCWDSLALLIAQSKQRTGK